MLGEDVDGGEVDKGVLGWELMGASIPGGNEREGAEGVKDLDGGVGGF